MDEKLVHTLYDEQSRLYNIYNTEVRKNLEKVEAYGKKDLVPIHNELRAFQDHLSRCFIAAAHGKLTQENLLKQTVGAEGHLIRCRLDCYKSLWIHQGNRVQKMYRWPLYLSKFTGSWGGEFLDSYVRLKREAKEYNALARRCESSEKEQAYQHYKHSLDCLTELEELYKSRKARILFTMWTRSIIQMLIIAGLLAKVAKTAIDNWDTVSKTISNVIKFIFRVVWS